MPTTIAKVLAMLMEAKIVRGKPISANELSRRTGVPQSTITRILTGKVLDPRAKQVDALAAFFSVSSAELRGEKQAKMVNAGGKIPATAELPIPARAGPTTSRTCRRSRSI